VIEDMGCGREEPALERIFEPFFATKQVGKRTGLSLETVYGIVKQCGGNIWYSEIDHGSVFQLPGVAEQPQTFDALPMDSRRSRGQKQF
jgi:C4-dicarboxylate-specific signal transduction histidine kinase